MEIEAFHVGTENGETGRRVTLIADLSDKDYAEFVTQQKGFVIHLRT